MWETKSGLNSELKGRMQQILDWLKPSVVLKEKGVRIIELMKTNTICLLFFLGLWVSAVA